MCMSYKLLLMCEFSAAEIGATRWLFEGHCEIKWIALALGKKKRNEKGKIEYSVNESQCEGRSDVSPVFTAERASVCVCVCVSVHVCLLGVERGAP